jgi:hypothetical protein
VGDPAGFSILEKQKAGLLFLVGYDFYLAALNRIRRGYYIRRITVLNKPDNWRLHINIIKG